MFKYNRIIKEWFRVVFSKRYLKMWIIFGAALALLIVVVAVAGSKSSEIKPEDTALYSKGSITVGVVDSENGFARVLESGEVVGFEPELIEELLGRIYPEKDVTILGIESQLASYMLKNGEIDLALGGFSKGVQKTQGLSVSVPYCYDGAFAYVKGDSPITSPVMLNGKQVLATTTEFTRVSIVTALEEKNIKMDISQCSSYPDGIENVEMGRSAALIALRSKMTGDHGLRRIEEKLMDVGFCVLAWTENGDAIKLIDSEIEKMTDEGIVRSLANKWSAEIEELGKE